MLDLRPMGPAEAKAFLDEVLRLYAEDVAIAEAVPASEALAKAKSDIAVAMPHGPSSPGHHFLRVCSEHLPVGSLWTAYKPDTRTLFLYQILIDEAHRGKGLGRLALEAVEQQGREVGAAYVRLHVFGHNSRARRLYRTSGYEETSVYMRKALGEVQ